MKKYIFLLPIFFLFLAVKPAHAVELLNRSENTTGTENTGCTIYGNADWCKAQGNLSMIFATPTNFNSGAKLTKVKVSVAMDPYSKSHCPTCVFGLKITNAHDDIHTSINTFRYSEVPNNGYAVFSFSFSGSDTINFADTGNNADLIKKLKSIYLYDAGGPSSGQYWGRPALGFQFKQDSTSSYLLSWCGSGSTSTCPHDVAPYLVIEDSLTQSTISWLNPPFATTFISPDFKLWKVCIDIPADNNISAFYALFLYGSGNVSDHQEQSYNVQTNNGSPGTYTQCIYFPKETDLTPGNYQAKVDLYNYSTDGLLAQSDAIYFQIITGGQGDYPAIISSPITEIQCNQSNIIARGFCEVLTYLFIPSGLNETQTFADTQSLFQSKAPFAYFYQLKSTFSGVSTSASIGYFINTTLASKDRNGNTLASIPFQFLNTGDSQTKGVFDDFRPYITAILWFGFATYLLTRAYRFFRPV